MSQAAHTHMRHLVQYHNCDRRGAYWPTRDFGIVTDKRVDSLIGERVWLILGQGKPRKYFRCSTFLVDEVGRRGSRTLRNYARGKNGQDFLAPIPIDKKPWFKDLLKTCGNFGLGLQTIKHESIIDGLREISS
jgi:hypothetical protein